MHFCSNLFGDTNYIEGTNYWKCLLRQVRGRKRVSETDLPLIALGISTVNVGMSDLLNGLVL